MLILTLLLMMVNGYPTQEIVHVLYLVAVEAEREEI